MTKKTAKMSGGSRRGRGSSKAANREPKTAPAEHPSQRAYLQKRDARIDELWRSEGYEPKDIATLMLTEGSLVSESGDSAERTVRGVVAKISARLDSARKDDAEPACSTNDIDALERKLRRLRDALAWQNMVASGEPDEDGKEAVTIVTMMGANGDPFQFEKPKWPAGVRQKAKKDAATLVEKIAELEIALAAKRALASEASEGDRDGGLVIIESDRPIPELIKANLIVGTFGKRGGNGEGGATATA